MSADLEYEKSLVEFDRARLRAFWAALGSLFSRRPNLLLPFDEVAEKLRLRRSLYRGVRQVEIAHVVGSVGRTHDFDGQFHPLQEWERERWARVHRALRADEPLPPVQLYLVGQVYFVLDGHHRISAAREEGREFIDAEVIELPSPVSLQPGVSPAEMIIKAEQAGFLEQTGLDRLRPQSLLEVTEPGLYDVLLEHIAVHRYYMGLEQQHEIPWEEAVAHWYDGIYRPIVRVIRNQGILERFPRRTETDLYVWVMDHRHYLSQESGQEVPAEQASNDFAERYSEQTLWERWIHWWSAGPAKEAPREPPAEE